MRPRYGQTTDRKPLDKLVRAFHKSLKFSNTNLSTLFLKSTLFVWLDCLYKMYTEAASQPSTVVSIIDIYSQIS